MSRFDFDVVTDPAPRASRPPQHEPEPQPAQGVELMLRPATPSSASGEVDAVPAT
jgi:hypothetical protein